MDKRTDAPARTTRPRLRPLWEHPERLTYEAAILARNPRLASLVMPTVDNGGRR